MKKACVVNCRGKAEKEELAAYLRSEGFAGVIQDYGERYGSIVNFERKDFVDAGIAVMAAACTSLGHPLSVKEFKSFHEFLKKEDRRQLVVHIPHAGETFPNEIKLDVDEDEKRRQHEAMKDDYLDPLVPSFYDHLIRFEISRIVCDVERFLENEPMERYGMGFCYKKGYNGKTIRWEDENSPYSPDKELAYYRQHHAKFTELCRQYKKLFILDLHSYQRKIIPDGMIRKDRSLPDVCLGFDERFLRPEIADFAAKKFLEAGFSVAFNYPYAGSFVPKEALDSPADYDCLSLMVEFNRILFEYGPSDLWSSVKEILDSIMLNVMLHCE